MKTSQIFLCCVFLIALFSQCNKRLVAGRQAPLFNTIAIDKSEIDLLQFRGRKVLLSFMRSAGCPVCNLHTHTLYGYTDSLKAIGVEVLMIYQSSTAVLTHYIEQDERDWRFRFVADTSRLLYNQYHVKPSSFGFLSSSWRGALRKRKAGLKLYKTTVPPAEGKRGILGADFLLDEQGVLIKVNYCRYVGDHLPPATIYKIFKADTLKKMP